MKAQAKIKEELFQHKFDTLLINQVTSAMLSEEFRDVVKQELEEGKTEDIWNEGEEKRLSEPQVLFLGT